MPFLQEFTCSLAFPETLHDPQKYLQRQLFIDYHYNFQMHPSKQHFLFLLLLSFIVRSQVLNPIGNCLGNCVNCASSDLSTCKGALPCEWGYYINSSNGTCTLAPSKQLVWAQLGERTNKNMVPVSESWGDSTKQIACEYSSPSGKKYIDALGLFGGVTMLQRSFPVNSNSNLFELSFNLLRDEWMPFNDFLLIDIMSNDDTVQSIQISYQKRIKVESQPIAILCGNKRVINEKFNVKIQNNNHIGSTLSVVFTSFLYTSSWGISNIKLLSACSHFSSYDANTEQCSTCDTDSYVSTLYDGQKMCEKCPSLCKTCISKSNCTACLDGSTLNKNGTCSFGSNFKTQQLFTTNTVHNCNGYSLQLSSTTKKIIFSDIKNENSQLYDQIQIHFKIYYNPSDWMTANNDKISIKINKVQSFILNYKNLTNKGTIGCKGFKSNSMAIIEIVTPKKIQNDNSLSLQIEYKGKNNETQFGVSDVYVKSAKKEIVAVDAPKPIADEKPSNTSKNVISQSLSNNNISNTINNSNATTNISSITSNIATSNSTGVNSELPITPSKDISLPSTDITSPPNTSNIEAINSTTDQTTNANKFNSSTTNLSIANNTTRPVQNQSNKSQENILTNSINNQTNSSSQAVDKNTTTISSPDLNQISNVPTLTKDKIQQNISQKDTKEPIINQANKQNETIKMIEPVANKQTKSNETVSNVAVHPHPAPSNEKIEPQKQIETIITPIAPTIPVITPPVISPDVKQTPASIILPAISQPPQLPTVEVLPQPIAESNASKSDPSYHPIQQSSHSPPLLSAAYIPTSNNAQSGLHVVISNAPTITNSTLQVTIDKLGAGSYSLSESYLQDSNLHIFVAINSSFIGGKMTVYKVASSRLLQIQPRPQASLLAVVDIDRYDALSSSQLFSISVFAVIFQVFAWLGVIGVIIAILSGYGVVMEEYVMSLQLLFLHVYIAADYLPLTFRDIIGGLRNMENLDFFISAHGSQIQKSWLGNVIQNGPIRFFLFNTDINFTREFYPIIIINIVYILWFAGLYFSKKFLLRKDLIDEQKPALYRLIDNIVCRPINYLDQIWRYQFLATVWCCCIQFYNLRYPEGSNRSEMLNAILCILAFICSLGWPVFLGFYCRKYYYENEYSDYLYRFQDVYYRRIPQYFLPSNHHRVGFPIVRSAKLFLIAVVIAYFGSIASLTLLILIGLQLFEVGYAKYQQIFSDHKYFAHRLIENALFALVELILFFLCNFSSLALTESYVYIGFVLSGMALVIVLNSVARIAHLAYHKYRQMFEDMDWELEPNEKPKTERVV